MIARSHDSLDLWQFGLLATHDSVCHAVTGRRGGVSEASYAELNLALHVGDGAHHVIENRRRVCASLGLDFRTLTFAQQVHADAVRVVTRDQAGAGRERFEDGIPQADGLVAAESGIALAVVVADCVPLIFYDPTNRVIGAVHAGWRGTAAGIAAKIVRCLAEEFGTAPGDLVVGLGPAIGSCCYRVSAEVIEALNQSGYPAPVAERRGESWFADLAAANQQQLAAAGLAADKIELSGICTSCNHDEFFSERKLGRPTGRFAAIVALR